MSVKLKPLSEQVLLITGASSGIGRVTAKQAAEAGAKVILVARNEEALNTLAEEIKGIGGEAFVAAADVGDKDAFAAAAEQGAAHFGRIDTFVNNAGTGQYANIGDDNIDDDKKLFETNFWGVVHGSRIALQHLRDHGGALINVGSEVSDVVTPTQGMYSASKHAVLGFTDAFRLEVIKSELPISVTLIKPAGIDTPFPQHAKNNTEKEGTLPAPVYAPELVADQILHAAEHPVRQLYVGGGGWLTVMLAEHFPSISDWVIAKFMPKQEQKDQAPDRSHDNLHAHETAGFHRDYGTVEEEGRVVRKRSLYGLLSRHPYATTFGIAAISAAAAYIFLKPAPEPETAVEKLKARARGGAKSAVKTASNAAAGSPLLAKLKSALADYAESVSDAAAGAKKSAAGYADTVRDYVDNAKDYAGDAVSKAKRAAGDYADTAGDYVDSAKDYAADKAGSAHGTVKSAAKKAKGVAGDYADAATDHAAKLKSAAGTSADHVNEALHEHLVKPAERLIASVKKKVEELLHT